jgi:segregation and condensation protein A
VNRLGNPSRPALGGARPLDRIFVRPVAKAPPRDGGDVALMEACLVVLRGRGGRPEEAPLNQMVVPDLWRVSDALARIQEMPSAYPKGGAIAAFRPILSPDAPYRTLKARAAVASTFLAGLELARKGDLSLEQDWAFGAVCIVSTQVAPAATAT